MNQEKLNTIPRSGNSDKTSTDLGLSQSARTGDNTPLMGFLACFSIVAYVAALQAPFMSPHKKVSREPKIVTFNTLSPGLPFAERARGISRLVFPI